jgi:hypothetical protein
MPLYPDTHLRSASVGKARICTQFKSCTMTAKTRAIPSFGLRSFSEGVPCTVISQLAELKYQDPARMLRRVPQSPFIAGPSDCLKTCTFNKIQKTSHSEESIKLLITISLTFYGSRESCSIRSIFSGENGY